MEDRFEELQFLPRDERDGFGRRIGSAFLKMRGGDRVPFGGEGSTITEEDAKGVADSIKIGYLEVTR